MLTSSNKNCSVVLLRGADNGHDNSLGDPLSRASATSLCPALIGPSLDDVFNSYQQLSTFQVTFKYHSGPCW